MFIDDFPNVIIHFNILLFADDAILVKIIKSEHDAVDLQLYNNTYLHIPNGGGGGLNQKFF